MRSWLDDIKDDRDSAQERVVELTKIIENYQNQIWKIDSWLDANGWSTFKLLDGTEIKKLPDSMAANTKIDGVSLSDMVYGLIDYNKDVYV